MGTLIQIKRHTSTSQDYLSHVLKEGELFYDFKQSKLYIGDGAKSISGLVPISGLEGKQGPTGPTGPQGIQGIQGPKGENGKDGGGIQIKQSESECKILGDAYVRQSDGVIMILTSLSPRQFTAGAEVKGPKGDKGDKGDTGPTGKNGGGIKKSDSDCQEIGDYYIRQSDGTIFILTSISPRQFTQGAQVKGSKGDTGATGPTGEPGSGIQIKKSESECEKLGDSYVRSDGVIMILTSVSPRQFTAGAQVKGPKGDNGQDGHSPVVTIGTNGNWFIDGTDTGKTSKGTKGDSGSDGHSPVVTIGTNGNWLIDGVDTGKTSKGKDGEDGKDGKDGDGRNITINGTSYGQTTPISFFAPTISHTSTASHCLVQYAKNGTPSYIDTPSYTLQHYVLGCGNDGQIQWEHRLPFIHYTPEDKISQFFQYLIGIQESYTLIIPTSLGNIRSSLENAIIGRGTQEYCGKVYLSVSNNILSGEICAPIGNTTDNSYFLSLHQIGGLYPCISLNLQVSDTKLTFNKLFINKIDSDEPKLYYASGSTTSDILAVQVKVIGIG